MKQSKVIVITGGIGSGKSTVCTLLSEQYPVLSSDEISREVIGRGDVRMQISERLTDAYYNEEGVLDRKAFGAWVFQDEERTKTLNEIMHGAIVRELLFRIDRLERAGEKLIFAEIPLFYEIGGNFPCDGVWVVTADEEIRVSRAMRRDASSEAEIRDRIRRQISLESVKTAYTVIENNGNPESLRRNVENALSAIGRK